MIRPVARCFALWLVLMSAGRASADDHLSPARDIQASHPWKIAFVTKAGEGGNAYRRRLAQGARQAGTDFRVRVEVMTPDSERYDVALQVNLVDRLAHSNIDGLVLAPINSNLLVEPVERVVAAGKPVVILDTPLSSRAVLTQLAFDNQQAGRLAAEWIMRRLDGRGRVLILSGQEEGQNAIERRNGFLDALAASDIEVLDMQSANWLRGQAERITRGWLDRFPHIDAILAANDTMALGVADAIARAGRTGILVTGVDANPEALAAIRAGRMHVTIEQSPEAQARAAVQLLVRHLERGETYPAQSVWREMPLLDRETLEADVPAGNH